MSDQRTFIPPNALTLECILKPSNGVTVTTNAFSTQEQLFNRRIIGISAYCDQDCTYSPISTANQVIPVDIFNNAYLRLYSPANSVESGLIYDQIPLCAMRTVQNQFATGISPTASSSRSIFRIAPKIITWGQKSSVLIPNSLPLAAQVSALFTIYYLDYGDPGWEWEPNWFPGKPIPQHYIDEYKRELAAAPKPGR